jgi:predicted negative regulator of RcsB-dependent stress response
MAIEFDCPHCGHHYRLKDELSGKAAACKNCRQKITIPNPTSGPGAASPPAPVDVEAAAQAALADAPKVEEDLSKKIIEVECKYCSHKWTEPIARAGKNTPCPNEECRRLTKIPEPKDDQDDDWRRTKTKGPSMAKDNQPQKLEGVQDAGDVKQLSTETLREKVIEIEYEPRPLRHWVLVVGVPLVLLTGLIYGVISVWNWRKEDKDDRMMSDSAKEFLTSDFAKPDAKAPKEVQEDVAVFTAVLHIAAGEYALRHNDKEKLKEAMDQFWKARNVLRAGASPARNAAAAELAIAYLALGGTEEQARDQIRIRWTQGLDLKTRPAERIFTVYEELGNVLSLLQATDFDFRTHLARRLTRELAKRGQPDVAEVIPRALFGTPEQPEAKAIVALELHRAKIADVPAKIATDLAKLGPELVKGNPRPASAQMLFAFYTPKPPLTVVNPVPAGGTVSDETRFAYTGIALQDKPDEALALAQRDGKPEEKLRSLVLCADWMADPSRALDAAILLINNPGKNLKDVKFSQYALLRLAQVAAEKGKIEQANQFANAISDEGLKAWAKGEILRWRLAAAPNDKGDEAWMELPEKPHAGHAWGRLWLARQNARISGDKNAQLKIVTAWPSPISWFGRAGVALGLQDLGK